MAAFSARGSLGINAMSGDEDSSSGIFDTSQPAGWFHILWFGSVLMILFFLWML